VQTSHTTLRRYRATLIPNNVAAEDAELKASQGILPTVQFQAPNSGWAERTAHSLTGLPVLKVERIEVPA